MSRLLALLALLAPAAAGASHGRLQLSLYAGGGLASDLFVGAGLGHEGLLELQPGTRLDLSFSPEWKAAARLGAGYAAFTASGFAAGSASGELVARWLRPGGEGSLTLTAERLSYTTGAPLDLSTLASPSVTGSSAVQLAPLARLPGWGAEWRLAGLAGLQSSTAAGGEPVTERQLAVLAGVGGALGRWALAASYRLQRTASDRPDFAATAHGLFATAARRLGPLDLEGRLQLLLQRTGAGARERLLRSGLSAAWPLRLAGAEGPSLALEALYAHAAAWSDQPGRAFASRHQVTLGLRGRVEVVEW